jgi:acyl-coenzyme A thioesterase PaaI-like protein
LEGTELDILTHQKIDNALCGHPLTLEDGFSRVSFIAQENMAADETGLVHGGFIFGLADYAAMISVNHPNVVLGSADVKFLKPVKVKDTLVAEAVVQSSQGKKRIAAVIVRKGDTKVFEGVFTCFVLERHVLA